MRRHHHALLVLAAACATPPATPAPEIAPPPRIILFIGDGVGTSYWSAARFAREDLALAAFPVAALVDTRNHEGRIIDSAAGATAYAAGILTYNAAVGVAPDSQPRQSIVELAEARGLATGLVATSSITHATPAAFGAHVVNRALQQEIAEQLALGPIDVLLGGGRAFFTASMRADRRDLLTQLRASRTYVSTAAELRALALDTVTALAGLFADSGLAAAADRTDPKLADMTRAAIAVLASDPDGFFLMVEASQPDWRGHGNEALARVTAEMLDFDDAIRVAADFAARTPGTLIVVTADHETGGLALHDAPTGGNVAAYTSTSHTAEMVPLFALGAGAERFGGMHRNADVGRMLREELERRLSARLRITAP